MTRTSKVLRRLEKDLGIDIKRACLQTSTAKFVIGGVSVPWSLLSRAGSSEIAYQELLTKLKTKGGPDVEETT